MLVFNDVPDRCRTLRARLGLSQERFGGVLGVERSAVLAWERGQSVPGKHATDLLLAVEAAVARGFSAKELRGAPRLSRGRYLLRLFKMAYDPAVVPVKVAGVEDL